MMRFLPGIFMLLVFNLLYNQAEGQEEIVTDRPDQTESSNTVPHHAFQLETGGLKLFDKKGDAAWGGLLLRYGLFKGFELRLGGAYGSYKEDGGETIGFSPVEIGFKSYITGQKGLLPEISFIGALLLPGIAASDLDVENPVPVFKFAFSNEISPVFSIGYNLGGMWNGAGASPEWFYSLVFGVAITDKLGCYFEPYGFFAKGALPISMVNGGFTYKITPLMQVDISGGFGLNNHSPDGYVSAGFSFRTK